MKNILLRVLVIVSAIALSFFYVFDFNDLYADKGNKVIELTKQIVSVAGVLLGFILTALSIMTAVMDKNLITNMVRSGHFKIFIKQAFFSCFLMFLLIVFGLILISLPIIFLQYAYSIYFVLIVLTIYELLITSRRFYNVIIVMSESVK